MSQADSARLQVDFTKIKKAEWILRIGGFEGEPYLIENVSVRGHGGPEELFPTICVIPPPREIGVDLGMPSILGRDFLKRYNLIFEHDFGPIILTDETIMLEA